MVTWENAPLENIAEVKTGPFGSSLHASDYVVLGTPIITVEHLGERSITQQNLPLVSDADRQRLSSYILKTGDIVFSRVGSVDRNAYVTETENGWLFSGRLLRIRVNQEDVDSKYLSFYFKHDATKQRIRDIAVGQTMASLNTKLLNSFLIGYPPLPQQRAIAAALSDVYKYIDALERLIIKKRNIKKGAMQELLTGKRRLPGFDGHWHHEVPFCSPEELLQGLTYSPANTREHGLLVLRSSNIQNSKLSFNDNVFVNIYVDPIKLVHKGDIIICVRNGSSALIGKCAIAKYDYNATWGAFMACIRSDRNEYLFQVFQSDIIQKQIHGNSNATINQITNADFKELKIPLPPTTEEQAAIVNILSDMDAEIDELTEMLNKVRTIKQGMMQELLTGRIRLKQEDTDDAEN